MVGSRTVNATINRNSEFGRRSGAEGFMQSVASKAIGLRWWTFSGSDELEITALLRRYARAVDTKDWVLYRSVFTDDAVINYSSAGTVKGTRDEVTEWLGQGFAAKPMSMHYITNIESQVDGDTARVRAMFYNPMQLPGMSEMSYCGGCYHHELVRTLDGWQSRSLREENVWFANSPQDAQHSAANWRTRQRFSRPRATVPGGSSSAPLVRRGLHEAGNKQIMGRFDGKVALITGAASGIGRAITLRLSAEGASVLAADIDRTGLAETASKAPGRVIPHDVDVGDPEACGGRGLVCGGVQPARRARKRGGHLPSRAHDRHHRGAVPPGHRGEYGRALVS
jgi:3-oxoacyl-ACP reductase-like protein